MEQSLSVKGRIRLCTTIFVQCCVQCIKLCRPGCGAGASSLDICTVGNASQFPTLHNLGNPVGWTTFACPPAAAIGRKPSSPHTTTISIPPKTTNPARGRVCPVCSKAYLISIARLSAIFLFQIAGPVICTDSPLVSTATVTGMSFTSNS